MTYLHVLLVVSSDDLATFLLEEEVVSFSSRGSKWEEKANSRNLEHHRRRLRPKESPKLKDVLASCSRPSRRPRRRQRSSWVDLASQAWILEPGSSSRHRDRLIRRRRPRLLELPRPPKIEPETCWTCVLLVDVSSRRRPPRSDPRRSRVAGEGRRGNEGSANEMRRSG